MFLPDYSWVAITVSLQPKTENISARSMVVKTVLNCTCWVSFHFLMPSFWCVHISYDFVFHVCISQLIASSMWKLWYFCFLWLLFGLCYQRVFRVDRGPDVYDLRVEFKWWSFRYFSIYSTDHRWIITYLPPIQVLPSNSLVGGKALPNLMRKWQQLQESL